MGLNMFCWDSYHICLVGLIAADLNMFCWVSSDSHLQLVGLTAVHVGLNVCVCVIMIDYHGI